tara:strand:+ start:747 stop:2435 length:1689 start_codon:yes stop_codon:yes gene_type:complete
MEINSLLESANPFKSLQSQASKLANKWNNTGLLEGIGNEVESNNMAMLLENQAKQLVKEANQTSGFSGYAGNAGPQEQWAGVALPLVRRVFGEIVAKDLVSVQPMNLPSGLIFYLDFKYGSSQPRFTEDGSIYGASDDLKTNLPFAAKSGLYGAGRFGYSINETASAALPIGVTAVIGAYATSSVDLSGNAGMSRVNYDSEFSASIVAAGGNLVNVIVATASLANFDAEGVRAFDLSGSALVNALYPQFTRLNGGNVEFVVSASDAGLSATSMAITYQKQPNAYDTDAGAVRGDFEDRTGTAPADGSGAVSTLDIPTIDVQLRSDSVTAKTRKLKAQWTPEFAQDLNAYHSIDAEAELTSILSEYISMEIDLEILDMLISDADTTEYWNATVGVDYTGAIDGGAGGNSLYYTKMSWYQTLGIKLQKVSNTIHQKTLRGGANFMVISPKVSTILESIPGFAADSVGDKNKYAMGVQKIGSINSRFTVYKNPYMTENVILMGYKGNQFLETGAVFAPYIPLMMTPLVYDPASFTPRKGIMTRYAKKMVRPDFYGKIYCRGLESI